MKTLRIDTPNGAIAVRKSAGEGPAVVLVHGNSSSSRAFARQLEGPLGRRFRLIAVDLPGHGESDDAKDPGAYSLPGYARAVRAIVDALGLGRAHFAGWSLGGHVVLEMAPDLPHGRGLMIFGTPPLAIPAAAGRGFRLHPAMRFTFQESLDSAEASAYVAAFFKPGFADVPAFFHTDVLRTDRRARSGLGASVWSGLYRDEVAIVRDLKIPLAVAHGPEDGLVNAEYFAAVPMPTLWRGAVQTIPDAGHAPHWETPEAFDALIGSFVAETA